MRWTGLKREFRAGVFALGNCKLCGEKAGFLRKVHGECNSIRAKGLQEMTDMAAQAVMVRNSRETQMRSDLPRNSTAFIRRSGQH